MQLLLVSANMLGGYVEPNEEPADVLKREFTEELGINPTCFDLFKTIEHNARFGKALLYVCFITQCEGERRATAFKNMRSNF
jgi:8-oxo-dGTP pyrophosphatase MutT (NUDIX family)